MPKKRALQEAATATSAAAGHAAEVLGGFAQIITAPPDPVVQTSEPIAIRSPHDAVRPPDSPDRPRIDALDPITKALGVQYWRSNPVYDWCRQPSGFRHRFTRYYFSVPEAEVKVFVLVDIFASKSQAIEKEVAQKTASIATENALRVERGEHPIGYLPIVRGATVPLDAFEAVKRGESVALHVRVDLNGAS